MYKSRVGLSASVTSYFTLAVRLGGLAPTLSLDFLSGSLDSRITFSRGSQATLVDSTGKLTYAPNNLLTNSQDFEAAAWTKNNATITANASTAPDGTTTADAFIENTTASVTHDLAQAQSVTAGTIYTSSVYIKAIGSRTAMLILSGAFTESRTWFNLSTLTATTTVGSIISSSITSLGNGWFRCSITQAAATTGSGNVAYRLWNGTTASYTGDGTSGIYIWGAQLEAVTYQTTPSTYNSTTPKNLLGYTQEFDNAAWTKSNAFVQTNLLTYSQDWTNAVWSKAAISVTGSSGTAPDGTNTATLITADGTTATHASAQVITASAAQKVFSFYAKAGTNNFIQMYAASDSGVFANFDLSGGTVGTVGGAVTATITSVGSGWYRCVIVTSSSTAASMALCVISSGTAARAESNSLATTVLVWGAQLVQGATAGNYQPTYAAAAAVQYAAPDGTLSADKLVETTATASHHTFAGPSATVASTPYTASVYLKAGERRYAIVGYRSSATNTAWAAVVVDLLTGTVGTPTVAAGASNVSASIFDAGNGWYRVRITATITAADGQLIVTLSNVASPTISNYVVYSYTGDGTSGIYIWGAQLSNSASLDPYVYNPGAAPTSAAYYGPRFDYDPVTLNPKGLLIEEQRTNLLTYSSDFTNAVWSKTFAGTGSAPVVTANAGIAPDGTNTAQQVVFNTGAGTTTGDQSYLSANPTVANATIYTNGVYVKGTAGAKIQLRGVGAAGYTLFTLDGTWQRISVTETSISTSGNINIGLRQGVNGTVNSTITVLLWGAQLEAGAFATSYIPTVASTVTRSADVATMTGTNFSSWYNQSEGTFVLGGDVFLNTGNRVWMDVGPNGVLGTTAYIVQGASSIQLAPNAAPVNMASQVATTALSSNVAIGLAANNSVISANGAIGVVDTTCAMPASATQLAIGTPIWNLGGAATLNGHIRRIAYYPTRLANATLQRLTA